MEKENKTMSERKIINLYEHFKNTNKKLKIICDWDEVIQAHEPYASWLTLKEQGEKFNRDFKQYFEEFWKGTPIIKYSSYGSKIIGEDPIFNDKQQEIKNSPYFYQQAPFLTIAEDLLKLIKEDKIEQIVFLSTYNQKKFPNSDNRKIDIFNETFRNFWIKGLKYEKRLCWLELIPLDSENQGQTKADWIKQNASDFDLVIDDNPNIYRNIIQNICIHERMGVSCDKWKEKITLIAPYYPAVAEQHHKEVVLVKQEVSSLKREDFK